MSDPDPRAPFARPFSGRRLLLWGRPEEDSAEGRGREAAKMKHRGGVQFAVHRSIVPVASSVNDESKR